MCLKASRANGGCEIIQTFVNAGSDYYPSGRENKDAKIVQEGFPDGSEVKNPTAMQETQETWV